MAILINLNDARKKLNELEGSAEYNKGVTDAFNALFDLPTIDAELIKHGRWIAVENGNDGDTKCSRCGCYHHVWEAYGYYCQHCGAKMDEVEE